tara:strand:- start:268 stop:465 length:198 start_codon:yes stop_codon:yes gene_type:complete
MAMNKPSAAKRMTKAAPTKRMTKSTPVRAMKPSAIKAMGKKMSAMMKKLTPAEKRAMLAQLRNSK